MNMARPGDLTGSSRWCVTNVAPGKHQLWEMVPQSRADAALVA